MIPFEIRVRPLLVPGLLVSHPAGIKIILSCGMTRHEAAVTLWHEVYHILRSADRACDKQSEVEAERFGQKMALACPEILTICGLDGKFP